MYTRLANKKTLEKINDAIKAPLPREKKTTFSIKEHDEKWKKKLLEFMTNMETIKNKTELVLGHVESNTADMKRGDRNLYPYRQYIMEKDDNGFKNIPYDIPDILEGEWEEIFEESKQQLEKANEFWVEESKTNNNGIEVDEATTNANNSLLIHTYLEHHVAVEPEIQTVVESTTDNLPVAPAIEVFKGGKKRKRKTKRRKTKRKKRTKKRKRKRRRKTKRKRRKR